MYGVPPTRRKINLDGFVLLHVNDLDDAQRRACLRAFVRACVCAAGVFDYYIAKLGSDMITLAEPLKKVVVNHPYGPCGANVTDDKPFIHKENGIYYLSYGVHALCIHTPKETQ